MHPLTSFLNYLKRKQLALVLNREHLSDRDLTEWWPDWVYEALESDEVRNQPYREAIQEAVSGKVVLELGTGRKALWAVCCAKAGAKRVYAVEANRRAYRASVRLVRSKKIENVHLICGFSDKIDLPERCEVLVHSLVGVIGSAEGMISFVEDAKRRLLTPDAIHIPHRCTTLVMLAEDPKLSMGEWVLSYGIRGFQSFDTLSFVRFYSFPHPAALSEPQVFEDFVFRQTPQLRNNAKLVMEVKRDGELRGVCFFIRLYVDQSRVVDSWNSRTVWYTPYIRLKAPSRVRKGDLVELTIDSDLSGNPSYSLKMVHQVNGSAREIGQYAWSGD
jgi:hypothetical protein